MEKSWHSPYKKQLRGADTSKAFALMLLVTPRSTVKVLKKEDTLE
jgi:hypothetical protein